MARNYFTGQKIDERTRSKTRRIADLLARYEIMEPPMLVEEDTKSIYTNKFWEFRRG
jgi:hypothetical protein